MNDNYDATANHTDDRPAGETPFGSPAQNTIFTDSAPVQVKPLPMRWYQALKVLLIIGFILNIISILNAFVFGGLDFSSYVALYPKYATYLICNELTYLFLVGWFLLSLFRHHPIAVKLCLSLIVINTLYQILSMLFTPTLSDISTAIGNIIGNVAVYLPSYFYLKKRLIPKADTNKDAPLLTVEEAPKQNHALIPLTLLALFVAGGLISGIALIGHPEENPTISYAYEEEISNITFWGESLETVVEVFNTSALETGIPSSYLLTEHDTYVNEDGKVADFALSNNAGVSFYYDCDDPADDSIYIYADLYYERGSLRSAIQNYCSVAIHLLEPEESKRTALKEAVSEAIETRAYPHTTIEASHVTILFGCEDDFFYFDVYENEPSPATTTTPSKLTQT